MVAIVNNRKLLHGGRVFKLYSENITLENGVTTTIDILRHPGAAAIVPMLNADTLILLRQYRHAVGDFIWEIPAGTLDEGESPMDCAKRELIEETGFSASGWDELGAIVPVPGYSDERIRIYLATDLAPAVQNLDRDELLAVHHVGVKEALQMVYSREIFDGKTITGLLLAANRIGIGSPR
jgi:8-oxo-dGTP pyrophosphatase MutT (NUDIX family)